MRFGREGNNYWINVPQDLVDKDITVLKIQCKDPIVLAHEIETIPSSSYLQSKDEPATQTIKRICNDISMGNNPLVNKNIEVNKPLAEKEVYSKEVLNWINKHAEATGNALKGLSEGHYAGLSALSKDRQTIYLFVEGEPNGPISLKGISNNIARIRVVGEGTLLDYKMYDKLYWSDKPGIIYIDIPQEKLDKNITVIAVLLDSPLKEYHGEVKAIESNL